MNQIRSELAKRGSVNKDADAAEAYARDLDYPSICTWKPDRDGARQWYPYAAQLGSVPTTYYTGEMYFYGWGVPENRPYGQKLMAYAYTHGFTRHMAWAPRRYGSNADGTSE
jgi:TPR repeat protein